MCWIWDKNKFKKKWNGIFQTKRKVKRKLYSRNEIFSRWKYKWNCKFVTLPQTPKKGAIIVIIMIFEEKENDQTLNVG